MMSLFDPKKDVVLLISALLFTAEGLGESSREEHLAEDRAAALPSGAERLSAAGLYRNQWGSQTHQLLTKKLKRTIADFGTAKMPRGARGAPGGGPRGGGPDGGGPRGAFGGGPMRVDITNGKTDSSYL